MAEGAGDQPTAEQDRIIARSLLASAVKQQGGAVECLMNNIRWFTIALLMATGNNYKNVAKFLRALAEGMDPLITHEEAASMLDQTIKKK